MTVEEKEQKQPAQTRRKKKGETTIHPPIKEPVPISCVKFLSRPIFGTNRAMTVYNFFTSIDLFNEVLGNKSTMLGTIRKNKSEIPSYFVKQRPANSSLFACDDNKVLVSYAPQKNRIVLLLSTIGNLYNLDVDVVTKKPAAVLYYNHTKSGTDIFDKFCATYTTSRKTNRWPLRFFCGMLDAVGINSMILLTINMRESEETAKLRRKFLLKLGHQLIEPHLKQRYNNPNTRRGLKETNRGSFEIDEEPPTPSTSSASPSMS